MALWLKAFVAFAEDFGSVLSTHTVSQNNLQLVSGDPMSVSDLCGHRSPLRYE